MDTELDESLSWPGTRDTCSAASDLYFGLGAGPDPELPRNNELSMLSRYLLVS